MDQKNSYSILLFALPTRKSYVAQRNSEKRRERKLNSCERRAFFKSTFSQVWCTKCLPFSLTGDRSTSISRSPSETFASERSASDSGAVDDSPTHTATKVLTPPPPKTHELTDTPSDTADHSQ